MPVEPMNLGSTGICSSFRFILGLDDVVRVASEFLQQVIGCGIRFDAEPMLWRHVEGFDKAVVSGPQFVNTIWLALERDDAEVIAVKERKHVPMHVKHQHAAGRVKRREWHLLLYIFA